MRTIISFARLVNCRSNFSTEMMIVRALARARPMVRARPDLSRWYTRSSNNRDRDARESELNSLDRGEQYFHSLYRQVRLAEDEEAMQPSEAEKRVRIKAFYVGRHINIAKAGHLFPSQPHRYRRDFLLVSYPSPSGDIAAKQSTPATPPPPATPVPTLARSLRSMAALESLEAQKPTALPFGTKHLVIFNYGSVVFFGFEEADIQKQLHALRGVVSDGVAREFMISEDYSLVERPHANEACVLRNDVTIVKSLDLHSATVLSTIMAQTVALDHYSGMVDEMLDVFTEFNRSVEKSGKFIAFRKEALFKLVASNNAVLIAVLSKLSLLERSDVAWKLPAYVHIWDGLRDEFEIEQRFDNIKYKLTIIQENTKFFLEVMHNQKSNKLEWIIIVLLSAEIVVMSMDLLDVSPQDAMEFCTSLMP